MDETSVPLRPIDPSPEPDLEAIRRRYVDAARAGAGQFITSGCLAAIVVAIVLALVLTVVLSPLAIACIVWAVRLNRKRRRVQAALREGLAFAERAVPVMGIPLNVNSHLRRPGGTKPLPGRFLISFDRFHDSHSSLTAELAVNVANGQDLRGQPNDFCRALMADERWKPFRRWRLPAELTGGVEVYACDLLLHPRLLARGHISDEFPLVPCMAEPGDTGRIVQLPYWLVMEGWTPSKQEQEEFLLNLAGISELTRLRAAQG